MDTIARAAGATSPQRGEVDRRRRSGDGVRISRMIVTPSPHPSPLRREGAGPARRESLPNNSVTSHHKISLLDGPNIELDHWRRDAERQAGLRLVIGVHARTPTRHPDFWRRIELGEHRQHDLAIDLEAVIAAIL